MDDNIKPLERIARVLRGRIVATSHRSGTPHLGSCLSCVDILTAAYFGTLAVDPAHPGAPGRDRFVLSKGHAAPAWMQVLAERGFFPVSDLDSYGEDGGVLGEHPPLPGKIPGVEAATGSLGHGLPLGIGMAYAGRLAGLDYRVFVLLGDGECNEGSVWEAAEVAPALGLSNLVAIVDYNRWQATGRSEEITAIAPLADKWRAFGWSTSEVDGHDMGALVDALSATPDGSGRPVAIIARTVKGKGVSFMEDDNNWHYRIPTADEVAAAERELGLA